MSVDNIKWIETVLVHQVLSTDPSLKGAKLQKCTVTAQETMKDNWASMMFEIEITIRNGKEEKDLSLILKLVHEDKNVREEMKSGDQFFNEIHLYSFAMTSVLSRINNLNLIHQIESLLPKCYYSFFREDKKIESPRDSVLVLENLKRNNYILGNRTFLDLQHCILAMETIGKFHASWYFMKEKYANTFKNVIQPIIETNYPSHKRMSINTVFNISEQRVIDGLATDLGENDPALRRLRNLAAREVFDKFLELIAPKEPLAVLCHGDFLRNNVLFRYEDGVPVDMKLIDFQTIRYASPAIDLSLFICMNTNRELRAAHFQQLLRAYHRSLRSTLSSLLEVEEEQLPEKYNFDAFMEDFRKHALYGYLITIDFMPWMMAEEDELAEYVNLFMNDMFTPKFSEMARVIGGEATTMVNAELAQDLIGFGCI